ncbi:MAG: four helix bundle protein [Chthoniobacterales bacterium]
MTNDEEEIAEDAFWDDEPVGVVREDAPPRERRAFDLAERTARFGETVIDFANIIPRTPVTSRLISQLVGCGTSVGANYCEADDAVSKKEFRLRCGTCKKEARETKFFLRMIVRAVPELKPKARSLWQEAKELHLIFAKIWKSAV